MISEGFIMGKSKRDKELDAMYAELKEYNESRKKPGNDLLQFFMGLLMLGAGLYMIFQNIYVTSSWGMGGHFFHIGSFGLPNGMVFLPLIIGILMVFMMDKKIFGWIVLSIGIVIILAAVLMSVHMRWKTTNGYLFVVMFGLVAAGGGMVIRQLFKNR